MFSIACLLLHWIESVLSIFYLHCSQNFNFNRFQNFVFLPHNQIRFFIFYFSFQIHYYYLDFDMYTTTNKTHEVSDEFTHEYKTYNTTHIYTTHINSLRFSLKHLLKFGLLYEFLVCDSHCFVYVFITLHFDIQWHDISKETPQNPKSKRCLLSEIKCHSIISFCSMDLFSDGITNDYIFHSRLRQCTHSISRWRMNGHFCSGFFLSQTNYSFILMNLILFSVFFQKLSRMSEFLPI